MSEGAKKQCRWGGCWVLRAWCGSNVVVEGSAERVQTPTVHCVPAAPDCAAVQVLEQEVPKVSRGRWCMAKHLGAS